MKGKFIRIISLFLALICLFSAVGCSNTIDDSDAIKISFKSALSYDYLKSIDGQKVVINGYIATSSPTNGSSIFLMNLPYQSCPYCKPNTNELSNTMKVYPRSGKKFGFTNQAIKVVGTLVVSPSVNEFFVDQFNYQFNFKIVDAQYAVLSADELSSDMLAWQSIANSGVISEIYNMYDYVNFVCAWNTYYQDNRTNADGSVTPGFYFYPSDALKCLTEKNGAYNYGYKEGYFDNIVKKIKDIDENAFSDLIANVLKAKSLSERAIKDLNEGKYTSEYIYVEKFGTMDYVYTLQSGEALYSELTTLFDEFSLWLSNWEM